MSRRILTGSFAAAMLVAGLSCGRAHRSVAPTDVRATHASPSGEACLAPAVPLADVLKQIDRYPAPKGVSAETWATLTTELKKQLIARNKDGEKVISSAPTLPVDAVTDLTASNYTLVATLSWTEKLWGDHDNDGTVDIGDLVPVAKYYMERTDGGLDDAHKLVVGDSDPEINIGDIQAIAANYGAHIQGYQVWRGHWNGSSTEWESTFRPGFTSTNPWSADRPNPPPFTTRPTYTYDDDISTVTDKVSIRYKVVAYGDGTAGVESQAFATPPPPTYSVSGTVLQGTSPVPGVTVTLLPGGLTATTQADGTYAVSGYLYGTYTLTPSKAGVGFTPQSLTVVVDQADITGQDFAALQAHAISGTVLESGVGLAGVAVTATPGGYTAVTGADGTYAVMGAGDGTYTVVPRKLAYAFTPVTLSVAVAGSDVSGQHFSAIGGQADPPWPKYRGNAKNTGLSPYVGAQTGAVRWVCYPGVSLFTQSSPVIGTDGTIYVGADYALLALSPADGTVKWSFSLVSSGSPIIAADGTVYIGATGDDGHVYALSPLDGSVKWRSQLAHDEYSSPTVGPDGTIYAGIYSPLGGGNGVCAINPADGTTESTFPTGDTVESSPAVTDDGTLYVGCDDGKLYAFNTTDGTAKWTLEVATSFTSSPTIAPDGTVYAAGGALYAINPSDGSVKWESTSSRPGSSPAIGPDGTVYVGSQVDNCIYALRPSDGSLKWAASIPWLSSSPVVGADGTLYEGAGDSIVRALNPVDGSLKWSYQGDTGLSEPAVAADGTVYVSVGMSIGRLYAFWP